MRYNIPPSLNWLIKNRARLAGKIEILRNKLADVQPLIDALASLEADLHSIDQSLKLHDIQIDIKLIKPIRPHYSHFKFPSGMSSVIVFNYFKTSSKGGPVSKDEIINLVTEKHLEIDPIPIPYIEAREYCKRLLARMVSNGYIIRLHELQTGEKGSWQIHPQHASKCNTN